MEENNNIFLAGGDALVYLAGPMHKKNISQHLRTDFSDFLPLVSISTHLQ